MAQVICIAGMHRSGTSLIASWLERCGLRIDDGQRAPGGPGNPRGHFEDADFLTLQQDAIFVKDPASKGWIALSGTFLSFSDADRARARELIVRRDVKYTLWGWKDPRSSLLLTQWKALIPGLKALLVWRPCSEVVDSLVRRAKAAGDVDEVKLSFADAVQMWLHYNTLVCEYKRLFPDETLLLPLDWILGDSLGAIRLLNQRLGLGLQEVPLALVFEDSLLKRQPALHARVASACSAVEELEKRLAMHSDAGTPVTTAPGHPLSRVLGKPEAAHAYLVGQLRRIDALEVEVEEQRAMIRQHEERGMERDAEIASNVRQLADRAARIAEQAAQIGHLEAVLERIRKHPAYRAYRAAKQLLGRSGPS